MVKKQKKDKKKDKKKQTLEEIAADVAAWEQVDLAEQRIVEEYRKNLEEQLETCPDMTVLYTLTKADFDTIALERLGRFLDMDEAKEAANKLNIDWATAVACAIDLLE